MNEQIHPVKVNIHSFIHDLLVFCIFSDCIVFVPLLKQMAATYSSLKQLAQTQYIYLTAYTDWIEKRD